MRLTQKSWWLGGPAAGLATAGVVIVQAAIPDPNGVIHACYRANGNLRLVDKSSCTGNETAISWSQSGPQGPQGVAQKRVLSHLWAFEGHWPTTGIPGGRTNELSCRSRDPGDG